MADLPQRHTIRRRGYDYATVGAYYLTICTDGRRHWFGNIANGIMHPSPMGEWAQRCWIAIPEQMPHVDVGEFVVMPNHVHGIVIIRERFVVSVGADHDRPETTQRPDTMPDDGATTRNVTRDSMGDGPDDHTTNAPNAQMRADHDRPLWPPAEPGAHPTTSDAPPKRTMPIVPVGSLGRIVRAYKSAVTRMAYRDGLLPRGTPVWQRNYWDRVIRDDGEWFRIAKYIRDNPMNWKGDRFNKR
jgi:putative transposase